MLIWFQNEFISKLHIIVIFILLINQEGVVVIKLLMKIMKKRKTMRVQRSVLPEKREIWRMRATARIKMSTKWQLLPMKCVKLPNWQVSSIIKPNCQRASWEQRDAAIDSHGHSAAFKLLSGEVECLTGSGSQVCYSMPLMTLVTLSLPLSCTGVNSWCTFRLDYPLTVTPGSRSSSRAKDRAEGAQRQHKSPLLRPSGDLAAIDMLESPG